MTMEPIKTGEATLSAALSLPEVDAIIKERDALLCEKKYGVDSVDKLPPVPDHVEALISPDGEIFEPRSFPFPCVFPKFKLLCSDSMDFWRTNGNTGYDDLLANGWTIAVWLADKNPLTPEEWANIQMRRGRVRDGVWSAE